MAKISSLNQRESEARFIVNKCKWRLLPNVTFEVTGESFLAVTQTLDVPVLDSTTVLCEKEIFVDKRYSDDREKQKSLARIQFEQAEVPFYNQKSILSIFRFEDVLFNLYPNLAQIRKKGMPTVKEIFLKTDPANNKESGNDNKNTFVLSGGDRGSVGMGSDINMGSLSKFKFINFHREIFWATT